MTDVLKVPTVDEILEPLVDKLAELKASPDWHKDAVVVPHGAFKPQPSELALAQYDVIKTIRQHSAALWVRAHKYHRKLLENRHRRGYYRVRFKGHKGVVVLCGQGDSTDSGVQISFFCPGEHEYMLSAIYPDLNDLRWVTPGILDENYNRMQ